MLNNLQVKMLRSDEAYEELDALVSDFNIQHKTKYLQTLTKNLDNNFEGYFAVAQIDSEIIAWTYVFIDGDFAFDGVLSGLGEKIYKLLPKKFKTAFISSPVAEYNMFHVSRKYKLIEALIIGKMTEEILVFLKNKKAELVIVKDHINSYNCDFYRANFIHLHFMPGTYIDFNCSCFEEYLMCLKKKWRANIRNRINRRKDDLKIEIINAAELTEEECASCHELYFQTRDKQRLKHELLSRDYFCECGKMLGEKCKMMVAKISGKIIGFAQLLENENDVINVRMGMDYDCNKDYNLYHHLLYKNIIYCLENNKKRLYTSQTCYRPKIEAGAKLLPLHTYIYFQNQLFQKIFGRIIKSNCRCYSELLEAENPAEILAKNKKFCS
ncbi:MAG: GNAT family N-acetyltransferase [Oscillospiraceae bacterium]|nr:GNAT family N-acetyltransferase [Oscillospiraceae bacterium]